MRKLRSLIILTIGLMTTCCFASVFYPLSITPTKIAHIDSLNLRIINNSSYTMHLVRIQYNNNKTFNISVNNTIKPGQTAHLTADAYVFPGNPTGGLGAHLYFKMNGKIYKFIVADHDLGFDFTSNFGFGKYNPILMTKVTNKKAKKNARGYDLSVKQGDVFFTDRLK